MSKAKEPRKAETENLDPAAAALGEGRVQETTAEGQEAPPEQPETTEEGVEAAMAKLPASADPRGGMFNDEGRQAQALGTAADPSARPVARTAGSWVLDANTGKTADATVISGAQMPPAPQVNNPPSRGPLDGEVGGAMQTMYATPQHMAANAAALREMEKEDERLLATEDNIKRNTEEYRSLFIEALNQAMGSGGNERLMKEFNLTGPQAVAVRAVDIADEWAQGIQIAGKIKQRRIEEAKARQEQREELARFEEEKRALEQEQREKQQKLEEEGRQRLLRLASEGTKPKKAH